MATYLITGANRGIGLGLTKKLLQDGNQVIATCRNPDGARDLWEVESDYKSRVKILECDVGDADSVEGLARDLTKIGTVDVLINNAGILEEARKGLTELALDKVRKSFEINVIGSMLVTRTVLPFLTKSKKPMIANMTSKMGSISDNTSGYAYAYRISKASLNMFSKCLAVEYPKIICVALHPGWVQTEMGGPNAPIDIFESVNGLVQVMDRLTLKESGGFFGFNGKEIGW